MPFDPSRRELFVAGPLAALLLSRPALADDAPAGVPAVDAPPARVVPAAFPTQEPELAREMVGVCHRDLERVKELLARQPSLARAAWDWGFGDWETALGAAAHTGRREIAELLLAHGARPTLFSAAMLGQLEVVRAFVAATPGAQRTPGPHGIPLLAHAQAGGEPAAAVARYLEEIGDAGLRAPAAELAAADADAVLGVYAFGALPDERIAVETTRNGLTFTRDGRSPLRLFHLGDRTFFPSGAPAARIRFSPEPSRAAELVVHDPDLVLAARRVAS
jgi:hypothetical protein